MSRSSPNDPSTRGLSFRTKLVLGVCGLVLLTGTIVTWLAHRSARQATEVLIDTVFREASAHAVDQTRAFMEQAPPVVEALRRLGVDHLAVDDADRLARQLLAFLQSNPGLSWVSLGDESGTFTGAYRVEGRERIRQSRIVDGKSPTIDYDVLPDNSWQAAPEYDSAYDPRVRGWYTKAKEARRTSPLVGRAGSSPNVVISEFLNRETDGRGAGRAVIP